MAAIGRKGGFSAERYSVFANRFRFYFNNITTVETLQCRLGILEKEKLTFVAHAPEMIG
jgi:hypothetical protein